MKKLNYLFIVFIFFTLTNCKKDAKKQVSPIVEALQAAAKAGGGSEFDSSSKNYVLLSFNEQLDQIEGEKNNITVLSSFTDDNDTPIDAGNVVIGSKVIAPNVMNGVEYHYTESEIPAALAMRGTNVTMSVTGGRDMAAEQRTVYIPGPLFPSMMYVPYTRLSRNQEKEITWKEEMQYNMFKKVFIQVAYLSSMSQYHTPGVPANVQSLTYTVDDNGSFTIPARDLARFPAGSYVQITIGRAVSLAVVAQWRTEYVGVISSSTSPLVVTN